VSASRRMRSGIRMMPHGWTRLSALRLPFFRSCTGAGRLARGCAGENGSPLLFETAIDAE
jgi:hypothetical protein